MCPRRGIGNVLRLGKKKIDFLGFNIVRIEGTVILLYGAAVISRHQYMSDMISCIYANETRSI